MDNSLSSFPIGERRLSLGVNTNLVNTPQQQALQSKQGEIRLRVKRAVGQIVLQRRQRSVLSSNLNYQIILALL